MVRVCCVKSCKEFWSPTTYLSFFAFPFNNEEMKEKWLKASPGYKALTKNSSICSNHFLPDDYTTFSGRRMLKKTAVPSVFGPNCCINIPNSILISDELCGPEGFSGGINMKPELINFIKLQLDALPKTSSSTPQAPQKDVVMREGVSNVSVQTCPRLTGPSYREKELLHKIRILQNRLRRREKMLTNAKKLVTQLKKANSSDVLEEKFLKKFTKFDLELFKNEANNNNVGKTSKTYSKEMKEFATTLYSYSPRAYKFVRAKINLPHAATLRRWIGESNTKDGEIRNEEVQAGEAEEISLGDNELEEFEPNDETEEISLGDNELEEFEPNDETEEVESSQIENVESIEMEEVEYDEIEEVEYTEIEEIEYDEVEEVEYNEVEEVESNEMEEKDGTEMEEVKFNDVRGKLMTCKLPVLVALPVSASKSDPSHGTVKKPPMTTIPISSTKKSNNPAGVTLKH